VGPICSPETSVSNHFTPRKNLEDERIKICKLKQNFVISHLTRFGLSGPSSRNSVNKTVEVPKACT
jgi:hypothetical protein